MTDLQYFKTDGIRGQVGKDPITPNFFLQLGKAIGLVLGGGKHKKIIIARDTRISGHMLQSALEFGILSTGTSILSAGCIPTSAVSYLTKYFHASAGIVISGSHNFFNDNGIKIFYKNGIKLTKKIEFDIEKKIKTTLVSPPYISFGTSKKICNSERKYVDFCKNIFSEKIDLSPFTIILDCSNGSTYNVAPKIFEELGATVITMSVNPNGVNINKHSGLDNLSKLKELVISKNADIGFSFDGDGDRVIMIDHLGNEVDGDQIIYIIAKEYSKKQKHFGGVVGTVITNMAIVLALKDLKIPFYAAPVGDRNVYQKMKEKKWRLGAEKSGHIILYDHHSTSDGIIASLQILIIMLNNNMTLHVLSNTVTLYPQVLFNVDVKYEKNIQKNLKVQNFIKQSKKFLGSNSRILIRRSGTESLLRIMIEGENLSKVHQSVHDIVSLIK